MKLTVEMSLYPLQDEYLPVIQGFIERLHQHQNLRIITNAMSTQVCGDFDQVFNLVSEQLKANVEQYGRQILVCKFIPAELDID
ncbi:MAG: YkoF family thiamine/hydroxymethylpyrimidine-binding protein [Parahaliea sp.]